MQKFFLVISFFFTPIILFAQSEDLEGKLRAQEEQQKENNQKESKDSLNLDKYKIFYMDGKIETADTSLTIFKDYKFNFLRKDNFELLSLANEAHTYNKLAYTFNSKNIFPKMGARGKHFHYIEKEDIGYYNVATPFTEIFAKSTFEQGQILDAIVSINLSPEFNFTLAHKGYKSLGKYQNSRSRGNQFRFSSNFKSKNDKLNIKSHLTSQNLFNQENGGLTSDGIYFFEKATNYFVLDDFGNQIENDDGTFEMIEYDGYLDRSRLPSTLLAESSLYSKRFFTDIERLIIFNDQEKKGNLFLGYQFTHEYKKLEYNDPYTSGLFGIVPNGFTVSDQSRYIKNDNTVYLNSNFDKLGKINLRYTITNFENNYKDYELENNQYTFGIKENQSNLQFGWKKDFNFFDLEIDINKSLSNDYMSDFQSFNISSDPTRNFNFKIGGIISKTSPNLNFILFRSIYEDYNWYNTDFENQKAKTINAHIGFKELIKISAEYSIVDNYTFFRELTNALTDEIENFRRVKPEQIDSEINYYKIKLFSKIDFGKFSLLNTAQYQKKDQILELDQLSTLNVPEWITRNTIMFSSRVFNNSLFIQTGITFNYFTKFYADYYNPLLSEFVTQNYKEIGEFPRFDFFFNAKIQQTRVFIKVEHLNSSFTGYDFYSDPFNPYRDLSVRFGLVWNFFQ